MQLTKKTINLESKAPSTVNNRLAKKIKIKSTYDLQGEGVAYKTNY